MAKPIMIQGTMSNAGKSLFAAALCRILAREGYHCAPFKSQNMALNSYITKEGLEMGRAQAVQAQAAMVEPSVLMNPILLKPTTDVGSQVIVNGAVRGDMKAIDYFRCKKKLIPEIMKAYSALDSEYDIIVIEGAGSPVELNLKADDIVNMGMAKLAKAPVLLVGDIDRGGVFAQLLGTLMLLEEDERSMVKGLVVNKFRGDKELFKSGADILAERSGKPVIGIVPYINCNIDDEDSLAEKLNDKSAGNEIDIAVIRLPRLSNFTDFDAFLRHSCVSVRYVTSLNELGTPDMVIIPGTKSTISDMKWLRESGLEAAVKRLASEETPVFGICGGYQMLGESIFDPDGIEGGGFINGMGLLSVSTVFSSQKQTVRTKGRFGKIEGVFSALSEFPFEGYEIHMGRSMTNAPLLQCDNASGYDGAQKGNVYGCYIHGIFDSTEVSSAIVRALCRRKGIAFSSENVPSAYEYRERQYNLLADEVQKSVDMEMIHKIIEDGV